MNNIKIGFVGGDMRQSAAAAFLARRGYECAVFGLEPDLKLYTLADNSEGGITRSTSLSGALTGAVMVVLPLPCTNDGIRVNCPAGCDIRLADVFGLLTPSQIATGGRLNENIHKLAESAGVKIYDYYEREELAVGNSVPTVEGAVAIAMAELPITLHGSRALIYGYGRIGKVLAKTLIALGAEVTVAARKLEDFAWIKVNGCHTQNIYELPVCKPDVVFNTVPAPVLGREALTALEPGTLIIELASKPGGVDMKAAEEMGHRVIWALSLPGRVAPVTSGKIIADCLIAILREGGISS
ncbi:MAG: dipicolinate synthase subunit DpsA [Eubacteriales bacterium]